MRDKNVIKNEFQRKAYGSEREPTAYALILEVLLDIRDLLGAQEAGRLSEAKIPKKD